MTMEGINALDRYNAKIRDIPMPERIQRLPVSPEGFPVPWFVWWDEGVPDFRVAASGRLADAYNRKLCWTCGEPLGRNMALLLGPMCVINRTISEPGSHRDCAIYAAKACPFLSNPRMRRNTVDLPEARVDAAGMGLKRNPGAVAVWVCREVRAFRADHGRAGVLFTFGDPTEVRWYCQGRTATRAEVVVSLDSGMPTLAALAEDEGPEAVAELQKYILRAQQYLPKE
jgi:hypothetical protein